MYLHMSVFFAITSLACAISFSWRVMEQGISNKMSLLVTLYISSLLHESRNAR